MARIVESELILNPDGSIYHLNLLPEDLAPTVILVGDPDRVGLVSQHFDAIETRKQKREFVTHTGTWGGKRITVLSTGIGTDNIDIVINELDALANIDLVKREPHDELTSLRLIRIGTSGALQPDMGVDSTVVSEWAIGLDGLMRFYDHDSKWPDSLHQLRLELERTVGSAYVTPCSPDLLALVPSQWHRGMTVTCPGFYGPQGRHVRAKLSPPKLLDQLRAFESNPRITNFEMETSGIYALGKLLGHQCLSVSTIIANRATGEVSPQPGVAVDRLISEVLDSLV